MKLIALLKMALRWSVTAAFIIVTCYIVELVLLLDVPAAAAAAAAAKAPDRKVGRKVGLGDHHACR